MTHFKVFLGAPTRADLRQETSEAYHWQVVSSTGSLKRSYSVLSPAAVEAASRRISLLYENVIFDDEDGELEAVDEQFEERGDDTSAITWPPTPQPHSEVQSEHDLTVHLPQTQSATFDTQGSESYHYSETSSITRFPAFCVDLHALSSLSMLSKTSYKYLEKDKVNLLLGVLEVEPLDTITIKKGRDAGKEVAIFKMILGDEDGSVCKLTAWREVANVWGGAEKAEGARRGDIVLLQNVSYTPNHQSTPTLTASPFLKSNLTICYRTMPCVQEDERLRPDLRLGVSDAGIRKVAQVVRWFEGMAGLWSG